MINKSDEVLLAKEMIMDAIDALIAREKERPEGRQEGASYFSGPGFIYPVKTFKYSG